MQFIMGIKNEDSDPTKLQKRCCADELECQNKISSQFADKVYIMLSNSCPNLIENKLQPTSNRVLLRVA